MRFDEIYESVDLDKQSFRNLIIEKYCIHGQNGKDGIMVVVDIAQSDEGGASFEISCLASRYRE